MAAMTESTLPPAFRRGSRPNACLALPTGLYPEVRADLRWPVVALPPARLLEVAMTAARSLPGIDAIVMSADGLGASLVARTRLLRFADDVDLRVVPVGAEGSSLMVHSRSRLGYHDLGTNKRRVLALLHAVDAQIGA
jgi:hypothetical protein